jgi:glycosyltransferase involved in cell wall biosynthesis
VPLLEAMAWDLPIVARAGAAVGETLGDGGLLLAGDASAATVAAAVARVAGDADVAAALARAGRRRLGELSLDRARQRWLDVLLPIVTGDAAAA